MSGSPSARTIVLALLVLARAVSATAQEPAPPVIPGPKPKVQPDDKRRTMRSYGHNLAYNFRDVLAPRNFKPLLITAAATAPSFLLDDEGERYFRDHPHESWGKLGANAGGTLAMAGLTIGVFSAGRISRGDRFRSMSYDLSQAILVTQAYTQGLKLAVGRERPDGSNNKSFPSGHSSNAFTAATVMALHYPKTAIPVFGVATYIAASRMAANKHHFSDIVAGAGLGWSIGRVVVRRNDRPPNPPKPAEPPPGHVTWHVAPWRGPAGDGSGFALVVAF
jgi:PAP2 superfamily protein